MRLVSLNEWQMGSSAYNFLFYRTVFFRIGIVSSFKMQCYTKCMSMIIEWCNVRVESMIRREAYHQIAEVSGLHPDVLKPYHFFFDLTRIRRCPWTSFDETRAYDIVHLRAARVYACVLPDWQASIEIVVTHTFWCDWRSTAFNLMISSVIDLSARLQSNQVKRRRFNENARPSN